MFIRAVQKRKVGANENPLYFRLCESYRDSLGKPRQRMIIALGYMEDVCCRRKTGNLKLVIIALGYMETLPRWSDKQELCRCLNDMLLRGQHPLCENPYIIGVAHHFYQKLLGSNKIAFCGETESANRKEAEGRKQEEVVIKLATLSKLAPKEIGAEDVALSCLERLQIDRFLSGKRWGCGRY
jgi:hypothetical protein